MSEPPSLPSSGLRLFDRRVLRQHRERAVAKFHAHSFLKNRAAEDLAGRLGHISRRFDRILDLGGHCGAAGAAAREWTSPDALRVHADLAPAYAMRAPEGSVGVAADEECLPFAAASFDAVISCLSLHWVNDLPGCIGRIRSLLRPDGVFIASMFGGDTLSELRQCLIAAESECRQGAAVRVSPFVRMRDLAHLMMQEGFSQPVSDNWSVTVRYADPMRLLHELRGMGETAVPAAVAPALTRSILERAMYYYRRDFSDSEGCIPASFEILTATGWVH